MKFGVKFGRITARPVIPPEPKAAAGPSSAGRRPMETTPPKADFVKWLRQQPLPNSFDETVDFIRRAPVSFETKEAILKNLLPVQNAQEEDGGVVYIVLHYEGIGYHALDRSDYKEAFYEMARQKYRVVTLVGPRRTGKSMGVVNALLDVRADLAEAEGRGRDAAIFYHEAVLDLRHSQIKTLIAILAFLDIPIVCDEYVCAGSPGGEQLALSIKAYLDDAVFGNIPIGPLGLILMGSEHGPIVRACQQSLNGMSHRGAAPSPVALPMPTYSQLWSIYARRQQMEAAVFDPAVFLRRVTCSGFNLADHVEGTSPTPEELLARGLKSAILLPDEDQSHVQRLVEHGFIAPKPLSKHSLYEPLDARILAIQVLGQKDGSINRAEGKVLELILRSGEAIAFWKHRYNIQGEVVAFSGDFAYSKKEFTCEIDLLLFETLDGLTSAYFFSAKRLEERQRFKESFTDHLSKFYVAGPVEARELLKITTKVTFVAFSAVPHHHPFAVANLGERMELEVGRETKTRLEFGCVTDRVLLGDMLQEIATRRNWEWKPVVLIQSVL
ncbi:hypothetical protein KFL_002280210 [Klebsormidium nitens]|uniref:Uncharacterized protein n=1 Tax=Klebsormidium nitens TaxID=105231 RepID=A0A1Y1I9D4_KLENI|nr:hypothetical protein KFL_002280210 [Klebsormidium nitens]|eukprot:GAQ85306.1 hypothetical protein KFL_002280210 [Klebsormidium nitens]